MSHTEDSEVIGVVPSVLMVLGGLVVAILPVIIQVALILQ